MILEQRREEWIGEERRKQSLEPASEILDKREIKGKRGEGKDDRKQNPESENSGEEEEFAETFRCYHFASQAKRIFCSDTK